MSATSGEATLILGGHDAAALPGPVTGEVENHMGHNFTANPNVVW